MESPETTMNQGTTKPSVFMNAVRYGLYTSAAYILYLLLMWTIDFSLEWWVNLVGYLILIAGIVLSIINYRDKLNQGFISFRDAFLTGLILSIICAIISIIYSWLLTTYIDPGMTDKILQMTEETLIERGVSDEMIEQQMEMTNRMMTGSLQFVSYIIGFVSATGIGAVISLICAAILKRKDDSFNSAFNEVR